MKALDTVTTCAGPKCTRPAVRNGLCHAHSQQAVRGRPLAPIRPPVLEPLEVCSIRLPSDVCLAVGQDIPGARAALVRWAKRRK